MLFGLKEMREFAENHEDERVRKIFQRLEETRSKNAQWCDEVKRLNDRIAYLERQPPPRPEFSLRD